VGKQSTFYITYLSVTFLQKYQNEFIYVRVMEEDKVVRFFGTQYIYKWCWVQWRL